jgi:hypothetical protein
MIWTVLEMVVVEMTVVAEVRLLTPISCILVISHNEQAIMTRRKHLYISLSTGPAMRNPTTSHKRQVAGIIGTFTAHPFPTALPVPA